MADTNDSRLDGLVKRAMTYAAHSKYNRLVVCLIASRVVGQYDRGATEKLARNLGVTVSRVQDYARAGLGYRGFRQFGINCQLALDITSDHLADAWTLYNKFEMEPSEIVADLRTAAEQRMTREEFGRLLLDRYGAKDPPEWQDRLASVANKLVNLAVDKSVPPESQRVIGDVQAILSIASTPGEPSWVKRAFALLHLLNQIERDQETPGVMLVWVTDQSIVIHKLLGEWDEVNRADS